jgi:hypothetical protein
LLFLQEIITDKPVLSLKNFYPLRDVANEKIAGKWPAASDPPAC